MRRVGDAGEQALLRRAEAAEATVRTLEAHVSSLQQRLAEADRGQRQTDALAERLERVEDALEAIRESHRRMALTVGELRDVALRLRSLADREPAPAPEPAPVPRPAPPVPRPVRPQDAPRREEMTEALATAVERLRMRVQAAPISAPVVRKPHKHSMSLIGRLRQRYRARKHRREGR